MFRQIDQLMTSGALDHLTVHVDPVTGNVEKDIHLKQHHPFGVEMSQDHDQTQCSTAIRQHVQQSAHSTR